MYRKILKLAGPIIFANMLQMVYQMTDLFRIGRYSTEGVAAISIASPIIFFFVSLGIGLTIAGTIMVAQARGSKRYDRLNRIVGQTLSVVIIYAVLISIVGYVTAPTVIGRMDADPGVSTLAISYFEIACLGMVSVFGYTALQSLWRGMGEVTKPVYIIIGTALINLIIDPLLIMGWGPIPSLGIDGAARSTMITQTIAFITALILIYKTDRYHLDWKLSYFGIHQSFIQKYLRLAIPSSIEMSARSGGLVILAGIVASLGTTITAAYGVGNQLFSIILFVALGFSMASTTLSGQFFGAQSFDDLASMRAKAIKLTRSSMFVLGLVSFIFAPQIASIFVPGETQVIAESARFVRIISLFLRSIGVQQIYIGMFRGLGETLIPMALTLIGLWLIQIPIAYRGSQWYGADAVWRSITIANMITMVIAGVRYHYRKRRKITTLKH